MAFIPAIGAAVLGSAGATTLAASTVASAVVGATIVGGTVAGVAGTVKSVQAAKASASAAQQAAQTQVRVQQQQVAQQRRQAIRRSIIARSQLRSRAQAAGLRGSSAAAGGISSLSSQLGTNFGFGSMMSGLGQTYTALTGQANYFGSQSKMFSTIAGLGFGAAQAGFKYSSQIGSMFASQPTGASGYRQDYYDMGGFEEGRF